MTACWFPAPCSGLVVSSCLITERKHCRVHWPGCGLERSRMPRAEVACQKASQLREGKYCRQDSVDHLCKKPMIPFRLLSVLLIRTVDVDLRRYSSHSLRDMTGLFKGPIGSWHRDGKLSERGGRVCSVVPLGDANAGLVQSALLGRGLPSADAGRTADQPCCQQDNAT